MDLRQPWKPLLLLEFSKNISFFRRDGENLRFCSLRKSPPGKIHFPYLSYLWGGQGLSGVIVPSVVCVWVRESGRGRHRSWKVLDAGEGETDRSEQASAGTLWKQPRADKLPNAPQLQGRSPDGLCESEAFTTQRCSSCHLLRSPSAAQNGFPALFWHTRVKINTGPSCLHSQI